ncbi:hypothetical protein ACFX13_012369 [Malus domestica]
MEQKFLMRVKFGVKLRSSWSGSGASCVSGFSLVRCPLSSEMPRWVSLFYYDRIRRDGWVQLWHMKFGRQGS